MYTLIGTFRKHYKMKYKKYTFIMGCIHFVTTKPSNNYDIEIYKYFSTVMQRLSFSTDSLITIIQRRNVHVIHYLTQ